MDNIHEKLSLFEQLIQCGYPLFLWTFTPDNQLVHTSCPLDLSDLQFSVMKDEADKVKFKNIKFDKPMIYSNSLNILWIADFEMNGNELRYVHVLGPMITGKDSSQAVRKKLYDQQMPVANKALISKLFESIPIIPTNLLYQYTFMLHYCITSERIRVEDIQYPGTSLPEEKHETIDVISKEHRGIWQTEQALLEAFRTGSDSYLKSIGDSSNLSSGVRVDFDDSLRKAKTNTIVLLTLCSRACMQGGLAPSISYTMFDDYIEKIDHASSITEISFIARTFTEDYIHKVQKAKAKDVSNVIANCLSYIDVHIRETIDLKDLAELFGYTEYYFSKKFKQEMHIGINEYIRTCKLEQAKLLLKTTDLSIQQINEELSFGTRSYFTECFKKAYGMSPNEYRNQISD